MPKETEVKLAVSGVAVARRLLRGAGFTVARKRHFERNLVFDTPELLLRSRGQLLRVREAGGDSILTYKGPPLPGRHKVREEIETHVESASALIVLLERLGYQPQFVYEKYRTEFRLGDAPGVAVLDETPIGTYLELEGAPRWIDRTALVLGFRPKDYVLASYGALYFAHCAQQGIAPANMVFERSRKQT
ncbi:MAG: class IV adenylate cyclase [Bryobacter sp.]|nr:class IV adenylate cyclase [Bryobacter sp.]